MDLERERALAVLRAAHKFPVVYEISVIAITTPEVTLAVRAAIEVDGVVLGEDDHQQVPSKGGKYTSHRFRVPVGAAEDVLALYERIRRVKGVLNVL
jgi:putative lipoic acid-binding regulatory protein